MAFKLKSILLSTLIALSPAYAHASPLSLFPNPDVLLDQADEEYDDYFSQTEWKLKTVEINGVAKPARYQSSVFIVPPAVTRTGIYSWKVVYRIKDKYRSEGQSLYACRTAAIAVRQRLSLSSGWRWVKEVDLHNEIDRSEPPCAEAT